MRYEHLLASRYIKAQKRQTAFTIVSIAAAVAIITMVFLLYSVCMDCYKLTLYNQAPFHLAFQGLTEEQGYALQQEEHIQKLKMDRQQDGTVVAYLWLDGDVGDREQWLQGVATRIGAEQQFVKNKYQWNEALLMIEGIGTESHLARLRIFCIFFVVAMLLALALRLVIDTAFEISSKERERHYGVLQSIGATPEQIVKIITSEGLQLCLTAVPLGLAAGIVFAYAMYNALLASGLADLFQGMTNAKLSLPFFINPLMLLLSAVVGTGWVFLSAYGVGMRIIKKTPMEAITTRADEVTKIRKRTLSGLLFGISGSMASRNARRQKKRFSITVVALTVSITMFALFSTAMESAEYAATGLINNLMMDSDFAVMLLCDNTSGRTYKDVREEIVDSGMFTNVGVNLGKMCHISENGCNVIMTYVDEAGYTALFGENPPVSYEELKKSGGYVLNSASTSYDYIKSALNQNELSVNIPYLTAPKEKITPDMDYYEIVKVSEKEAREHTATIVCETELTPSLLMDFGALIGTMDTYDSIKDEWYCNFEENAQCFFSSLQESGYNAQDHKNALDWFHEHVDSIELLEDGYDMKWKTHNIMSAVKAGMLLLNVLIALTALINLMNIISTGISNRRSELASLQCIGMTDRQLDRMALIECLQFAGAAAAISAVITTVVIFGTEKGFLWLIRTAFAEESERMRQMMTDLIRVDHLSPYLRILFASLAALAAGCVTSLVMLRVQNSESLTDQIRGSEMKIDTKPSHFLRNSIIAVACAAVIAVAGLRIYNVVSFRNDRKVYEKAGYLNLVDTGGMKMNVYSTGKEDGKHTIVGLAGMGVNCYPILTEALNARLGEENTLVYPDRAGYGLSDDSLKKQTLEQVVSDYRKGLQNAGFAPPYVLMVHSYGSYYALYWEAMYPDEVEAIIFLDGTNLPKDDCWRAYPYDEFPRKIYDTNARRAFLRTWLGLDRLFPAGREERSAQAVLSREQLDLWKLTENRTYSAAAISEIKLEQEETNKLQALVKETDTPKLWLSTIPTSEADVRVNLELQKADFEAAGQTFSLPVEEAAKSEWKRMGWYYQDIMQHDLVPFIDRIGSCRMVTVPGEHGVFYAQQSDVVADTILDFLAETE